MRGEVPGRVAYQVVDQTRLIDIEEAEEEIAYPSSGTSGASRRSSSDRGNYQTTPVLISVNAHETIWDCNTRNWRRTILYTTTASLVLICLFIIWFHWL